MLYIVAVWDKPGRVSYGVEVADYWDMVAWVSIYSRFLFLVIEREKADVVVMSGAGGWWW
jgi:hypothetical protein